MDEHLGRDIMLALFALMVRKENVLVQNNCGDRHEQKLCKRVRFVLLTRGRLSCLCVVQLSYGLVVDRKKKHFAWKRTHLFCLLSRYQHVFVQYRCLGAYGSDVKKSCVKGFPCFASGPE